MPVRFKDPVVDLYYRRAGSQAAYWLSVLGYNVKDRSLTNRFYLIYFGAFWGAWIVAMFFLVSYVINIALKSTGSMALLQHSVILFTYAAAGWVVFQLWKVAGRSPFMFSEEDAYLLCQTPVSRRTVGLARFILGWLTTFIPIAGIIVAIAFTLVEAGLPDGPALIFIGRYLIAGLQALGILLPLQMGLQAAVWGLGALRISPPGDRQARIQGILRGLALLMALLLGLSIFFPNIRTVLLFPLYTPVQAAFGSAAQPSRAIGPGISLLSLLAGWVILGFFTNKMNLNQAAQETKVPLAIQTARSLGSFNLADVLNQQQRLTIIHPYQRLPSVKGSGIWVWKDAVQAFRSIRFGTIVQWILVFFLLLTMFSKLQWGAQLFSAGIWALQTGTLTTQRARKDLSRWWLFHSLPMRIRDKVWGEITLPVIGISLLGWLAAAVGGRPLIPALMAGLLLPLLAINAALSTLVDIFHHMETRLLLTPGIAEENVPQPSTEGLLTLLVSTLAPFLLLLWQFGQPDYSFPGVAAILLAGGITILSSRSIKSAYRWIE